MDKYAQGKGYGLLADPLFHVIPTRLRQFLGTTRLPGLLLAALLMLCVFFPMGWVAYVFQTVYLLLRVVWREGWKAWLFKP